MKFGFLFIFFCAAASCFAAADSAAHFPLAEQYFSDSMYGPALQQYRTFLAEFGKQRSGSAHAAATQLSANEVTASYKAGICLFRMKAFAGATEALDDFVKRFSADLRVPDAMYYAAVAQKELGNNKEAADRFFNVWSAFPICGLSPQALYKSAECARDDGNVEKAAELFAAFCERFPRQQLAREAFCTLVKLYLEEKNYADAAKAVVDAERRFFADDKFAPRLLYCKALIASLTGKTDHAARFYSAMLASGKGFPEEEEAYLNYISFLSGRDDRAACVDAYRKLADYYQRKGTDPSEEFIFSWAECAMAASSWDLAERLYKKAAALGVSDSSASLARFRIAQCQEHRGSLADALQTLSETVSKDSLSPYGRKSLSEAAEVCYGLGLYADAITAYRRCVHLTGVPDAGKEALKIADIFREKYKRYAPALQEYENFLSEHAESPLYNEALFSAAQCEEALGNVDAALRKYASLAESDASADMVEKAERRVYYLQSFRARDLERAVAALADLSVLRPDSLSPVARLSAVADVYSRDLHEYGRALRLLDQAALAGGKKADSTKFALALRKASVYESMCEKARFEHDTVTADSAGARALGLYSYAAGSPQARVADDAGFGLVMFSHGGIESCERFIASHPASVHRAELSYKIAAWYESRADSGDPSCRSKAAAAFKNAAQGFPGSPFVARSLLGCGRTYCALDKPDSAEPYLKEFFARYADSACAAEAFYLEGLVCKSRHRSTDALQRFSRVLDSYPLSPFVRPARYEAAEAYFSMGKYHEALTQYRLCTRGRGFPSQRAGARLGLARCLVKLSRRDEAAALLGELAKEKLPCDAAGDVLMELAGIAESKGLSSQAIECCSKAAALDGYAGRQRAFLTTASLYFGDHVYAEAAAAFRRALQSAGVRSDSADACAGLASALLMDGRQLEADRISQLFKAGFGTSCNAYSRILYHEGLAALLRKDYDKARSRFNYIFERYPDSPWRDAAAYHTALAWFYEGKTSMALDRFGAFVEAFPRSGFTGSADFKLGMIYHDQNDFEQAAKYFVAAESYVSTDRATRFRAAYNAALDYQRLSRWLDAARIYETIIDSFPENVALSSAYLKTGFCLVQASRFEEALKMLAKASANPSPEEKPEILYWTATCYAKQGDLQKASAEFLKVPSLYRGIGRWGLTAECEAARIFERLGEYRKAVSLYRKIVRADGETGELGRQAFSRVQQLSTLTEIEQ